METVNLIREYVANGKLKKAIKELVDKYQNTPLKDKVISLSSRYKLLEDKKIYGIIPHQEIRNEENNIAYSVLELLNQIEEIHTDSTTGDADQILDERSIVEKLSKILKETKMGFRAQAKIRNSLYSDVKKRIGIKKSIQYENFFYIYHSKMNQEELKYHKSLRYYSENILNKYNRKALELIIRNDHLKEKFPNLKELERHLLIWIGKFERLFYNTPSLGLVYVGVDEENPIPRKKAPFPSKVEEEIDAYLDKN